MSVEKIKSKIMADAEREAKKIMDSAKKEADKIKDSNKKLVDEFRKKKEAEIKAEVKLYKDKTLAQARLGVKRDFLKKREEIIGKYIEEAMSKLDSKSKDYEKFLKAVCSDTVRMLSGDITIYCNKNDTKDVAALAKKAEVKTADIVGGAIFEDSTGKRIDESLNSRLERIRNQLRQEMIKVM